MEDDYLVKLVSNKELLARIRAVLRRAQMPGRIETGDPLRFTGFEIHPTCHEVKTPHGAVKLTPTEHKLLYYLASNPGRTLAHWQLLSWVWGNECDYSTDNLWVHISRLRKKIESDPCQPRDILTEPELGYRFVDPDSVH